jgi:hypothetical protein
MSTEDAHKSYNDQDQRTNVTRSGSQLRVLPTLTLPEFAIEALVRRPFPPCGIDSPAQLHILTSPSPESATG